MNMRLEALSRPSAAPLFELRGNPRFDVSASFSFLKALSCSLAVSVVSAWVMLELCLVRLGHSWFWVW